MTDVLDQIYALTGLVNDAAVEAIVPDYDKPASWAFRDATVNIIKSRKDLNMLVTKVLSERSGEPMNDPGSWIPWTLFIARHRVFHCVDTAFLERRFSTVKDGASTGRSFEAILYDAESHTITLSGTIIGTIRSTMSI